MKIRNLPFSKLNEEEKAIVKVHYKSCLDDCKLGCSACDCSESINIFWEKHRESDTENGNYDDWIKQPIIKELKE